MKKFNAVMIAAVMGMVMCISACGTPKEESAAASASASSQTQEETVSEQEEETVSEAGTTGGWEIFRDGTGTLPEEVQKAFDKAMESYDGMNFEPIALLGSQVVAGMNYQILCRGEQVVKEPVTKLYVVTVYADLEDNATITNVADFDLGKIEESDETQPQTEILAGGWSAPQEDAGDVMLPQDAASAFSAGIENLTGVEYTPVSLLGTKVIAGTEYAFLALATPVTKDPVSYYTVIFVAENPDHTYDLIKIVPIDPADYTK